MNCNFLHIGNDTNQFHHFHLRLLLSISASVQTVELGSKINEVGGGLFNHIHETPVQSLVPHPAPPVHTIRTRMLTTPSVYPTFSSSPTVILTMNWSWVIFAAAHNGSCNLLVECQYRRSQELEHKVCLHLESCSQQVEFENTNSVKKRIKSAEKNNFEIFLNKKSVCLIHVSYVFYDDKLPIITPMPQKYKNIYIAIIFNICRFVHIYHYKSDIQLFNPTFNTILYFTNFISFCCLIFRKNFQHMANFYFYRKKFDYNCFLFERKTLI